MIDIQKITIGLQELEKKVDEALSGVNIPTDKKDLIACFAPPFKAFLRQFDANIYNPIQHFHFAAIYGLVRIHAAQIKDLLACYKSNVGYARSFAENDPSQTYHAAFVGFLDKFENDFQTYRRSAHAKNYITYIEAPRGTTYDPDFHEGFSFGTEMANEKDDNVSGAPPTSLAQLEMRVFALAYFDMYKREVDMILTNRTRAAVASNFAAALFAPMALPITLGVSAAHGTGHLGAKANNMKAALEGSVIKRFKLANWRLQVKGMLSRSALSNAALKILQPPPATSVQKRTAGLFG